MVSNKKSRSRKKYQYHVNRSKVQKKARKQPTITCPAIKKEWKGKLSVGQNLSAMGLVIDPNKSIPITATEAEISSDAPKKVTKVVEQLEKETKAPRNGTTRMAKEKTKWIQYLLDKYGEDYEAMAMDKNNHYQETAAQIKQKIKQFKKRPAYLVPYLRERELLTTPSN